jgi:hypothetical protein
VDNLRNFFVTPTTEMLSSPTNLDSYQLTSVYGAVLPHVHRRILEEFEVNVYLNESPAPTSGREPHSR